MKKTLCMFLLLLGFIFLGGFKQEESYIFSIEAYYPIYGDLGLGFLEIEVDMDYRDDFKLILEDIFKNPPIEGLTPSMTQDTKINDLSFNSKDRILNMDISKDFLDSNMGSSLEYEKLMSLVNTLGKFYNINRVHISIEGKPYESGHFILRHGEFFNVDFENVIKIN